MRIDYGPGVPATESISSNARRRSRCCCVQATRARRTRISGERSKSRKTGRGEKMATARRRTARRRKKESFSRWDAADYLKSEADMMGYLEACLAEVPDDA